MGSIPDQAVEVVKETWETGSKKTADYYLEGQEVGYRYWGASGILLLEGGLQNGKRHGQFRTWHDNGTLQEEGYYHEGKEHGETKQYDYEGKQIGGYVMQHGTGTDLWFCAPGVLSEEREYLDGYRHGYERWWNGDNRTVYQESHYSNGIEHGIFRRWNPQGKLRRGYPQYFVMGKRTTKRQYERACQKDLTLPRYVAFDNQPIRRVPAAVLRTNGSFSRSPSFISLALDSFSELVKY